MKLIRKLKRDNNPQCSWLEKDMQMILLMCHKAVNQLPHLIIISYLSFLPSHFSSMEQLLMLMFGPASGNVNI